MAVKQFLSLGHEHGQSYRLQYSFAGHREIDSSSVTGLDSLGLSIDLRHFQLIHTFPIDVALRHLAGHGPAESLAEFEIGQPIAPIRCRGMPQQMWIDALAQCLAAEDG